MTEINLGLINGLMFGIEFPPVNEIDEDLTFAVAIDLAIVRVMILRWKTAE